jgi:uncharacterized protein (TIGR01777 family)
MNILVSGSTGLIGSALISFLEKEGHGIKRLVRKEPTSENQIFWNPGSKMDSSKLEGFDAVVHLAGESIMGRWNDEKKAKIRNSRVEGTKSLAEGLASTSKSPRVFVCASAVGYYGDRGNELLKEDSPPGTDFLAESCREWEAATGAASTKGIRVANTRFGVVLSDKGGAVKQMMTPFRLGLGGKIGSGNQYWSWIAIDDVVHGINHVLQNETLQGPVNFVSPNPLTNEEFTRIFAKVLHRPAIFPMPKFAARKAFGEVADALLLASQRAEPTKLLESHYPFRYPELEGALRNILDKR